MTNSRPTRYSVRRTVRLALDAVASRLPSRVGASASLVLAYHNIVPEPTTGNGDVSLHLSADHFARQLRIASAEADLVDLPTLLREVDRRGRRIAVTFDDAYRGCLEFGLPLCAAAGVVPTVFVAPALYGRFPIWDVQSQQGAWTLAERERFLLEEKGLQHIESSPAVALPPHFAIATLEELRGAVERFVIHIGNHSLSHANLSALDDPDVLAEVRGGAQELAIFRENIVPLMAYPYGLSPGQSARTKLTPLCDAAFLVEGGWMQAGALSNPYQLPRLNVPAGLSAAGFRAKLRGWSFN